MKPLLLLVHGWGFDAGFWAPLRAVLPEDSVSAWDLGFFGAPDQPVLPVGRKVVAVGHSFGLLWLQYTRPVAWRGLVSINGFNCFARREDFAEGVAGRVLQRMMAQFSANPERVVADFRARCGADMAVPAGFDVARLLEGLQALAGWDARAVPVRLALCGRNDPVVPAAMSRACFGEERIVWHEGGHLLPWEDPVWCAEQLCRLMDSLA